jgi:hypothetical protein
MGPKTYGPTGRGQSPVRAAVSQNTIHMGKDVLPRLDGVEAM